jgi:uncharacterized membrane protein
MPEVRHEFRIDAPADRVWAVAIDANRIPEWQTNVVEISDVTGRLDQVGARYTAINKIAGRPLKGEWEVTKAEPNRLLELTGKAPGGGRAMNRIRLIPSDGATGLQVELDYELPGGFLGQFANRLFVERALQRDVQHSSENFKALCEQAETA